MDGAVGLLSSVGVLVGTAVPCRSGGCHRWAMPVPEPGVFAQIIRSSTPLEGRMCARTREASKVRAAHPSYKISGALRDAGNIYGRHGVLGRWDRLLTRMDKVLQN